jgi:hypothetical protein
MRNHFARVGPRVWTLSLSLLAACSDDGGKPERDGDGPLLDGGLPAPVGPGNMDGAVQPGNGTAPNTPAGKGTAIPRVTPLVRAATPASLGGASALRKKPHDGSLQVKLHALDSVDLKSRFFTEGPTSIYRILADLDARVDELNMRSMGSTAPCLSQQPVRYDIHAFGQTIPFYAQCSLGAEAGPLFQFGQKDGVIYLYVTGGVQHAAVRLTPATLASTPDAGATDAGTTDVASADASVADGGTALNTYRVDAWMGLGYNNATSCGPMRGFDGCSYGVIELHTDASRRSVELSVAGVGFGYCGAQLRSDADRVFARGSIDMGETCLSTTELCVQASDVTTPAVCSPELRTFASPALGRKTTVGSQQSFGESQYPGAADNQITLDGSATDSLDLGPVTRSEGVGVFVATAPPSPGK